MVRQAETTLPLAGQVLLVTGGAQGIGRAVAERAGAQGAAVAIFDIAGAQATEAAAALVAAGVTAAAWAVDVSREDQVAAGIAAVQQRFGKLDILINNAGRNNYASAVELTEAQWDDFLAVDLKAAWLCAKYALPIMINQRGGSIVNVASVHATMTAAGTFPYAAAKSGLLGLTRSLALDYGPQGVRVNAVSPGYTATRLVEEYLAAAPAGERERVAEVHALRRIGTPQEIANVVCFLASAQAAFVTGANWVVDGGISARFA